MKSLIIKLLIVFFICNPLFSQTKSYSDILPKGIKACPILDSENYLPDSLKQPVYEILRKEKFDLSKCFVDKKIETDRIKGTITIRIWDVDDLKYKKKIEKSNKIIEYESSHKVFYSGYIVYNIKTKTLEFFGDQ